MKGQISMEKFLNKFMSIKILRPISITLVATLAMFYIIIDYIFNIEE